MKEGEVWNVVVAEFEADGGYATITSGAATSDDDAIQNIINALAEAGIPEHLVVRLYSERKPSDEWCSYFAEHWPQANITWGFEGDDAAFEAALDQLRRRQSAPWWKFW